MPALEDVKIVRYLRTLRGGSQPMLAEASDGIVYVVKFAINLQGPNLLLNESAGTELFRSCGLAVPAWKPLLVTDDFLDRTPDCWIQTPEGVLRPHAGLCFGSRFLGASGQKVFELLPGSSISRIRNGMSFWLAHLLDVCCEHADNRQAVFVENVTGWLEANFIDHGHLFGGPDGTKRPHFQASCYLDARVYPDVPHNFFEGFLQLPRTLDLDDLWRKVNALPEEWKSGSGLQGLERCFNRLATHNLLRNVLDTIVDAHKRKIALTRSKTLLQFEREPAVPQSRITLHPDWESGVDGRWQDRRVAS
jgi:hypothetical protein